MADTGKIKKMVANGNEAWFRRYFDGHLWYQVVWEEQSETGDKVMDTYFTDKHEFEFPVPISDIGSATFHAREKAILMMRYIRKHLEYLDKAKVENGDVPNK